MSTPQYPAPQQPQWQPTPVTQPVNGGRRDSGARVLAVIGALVGVAGLAVATWSVATRPEVAASQTVESTTTSAEEESYTPEEVAAAQNRICEAHKMVAAAVTLANNPPDSTDNPGLQRANLAIAQLTLVSGAAYLENQMDPATPQELREMVQMLRSRYLRVAVGGAAGGGPTYDRDVTEANAASTEVERLCQ